MNSKTNELSDIAMGLFQSGQYNRALREHLVKVEKDYLSWYDKEVSEHFEDFMDGVEGDYDWRRRLGKIDADEMVFTYHYEFIRSNTDDVVHHWESLRLKLRGEFVGQEAEKHGCHHCHHLPCRFKRFQFESNHQRKMMIFYGKKTVAQVKEALRRRAASEFFGSTVHQPNAIIPDCFVDGIDRMDVEGTIDIWSKGWPENPRCDEKVIW